MPGREGYTPHDADQNITITEIVVYNGQFKTTDIGNDRDKIH